MSQQSSVREVNDREGGTIVRTAMIMGLPFSVHLRRPAKRTAGGNASSGDADDIRPFDIAAVDAAADEVWEATATVAGGVGRMDHARWPPGHEVLLVTDDGSVMVSAGFAAFFGADVPVPPHSIIG